jgi:nucleoid-associated protein YgaU
VFKRFKKLTGLDKSPEKAAEPVAPSRPASGPTSTADAAATARAFETAAGTSTPSPAPVADAAQEPVPAAAEQVAMPEAAPEVVPEIPAVEAAAPRTHVVQSGDTLSAIAQQYYGDANAYMRIFEANRDKLDDPNLIHPGQELVIPE